MKVPADDAVSYTVYRVAVRLPPFWPDQPALWFVQAEQQLVSSHHAPYSLVGYLDSNVDRPSQPNKDNISSHSSSATWPICLLSTPAGPALTNLTAAVSEPALYRFITLNIPNLMSLLLA